MATVSQSSLFFSIPSSLAAAVRVEDKHAVIINLSVDTDWVADLNVDYLLFPKSATRSFVKLDMLFLELDLTRHHFCFLLSVTGSDNTPKSGQVKEKKKKEVFNIVSIFFLKGLRPRKGEFSGPECERG